jgi:hypothetical protein
MDVTPAGTVKVPLAVNVCDCPAAVTERKDKPTANNRNSIIRRGFFIRSFDLLAGKKYYLL